MSEVKNCLPPRSSHHKKKKKKKSAVSATAPENKDQGPDQEHLPKLEVFCKKYQEHCSSQKTRNCYEDSQFLLTAIHKTSTNASPSLVTKLGDQVRESLRWEGVLQDPEEEAKRLELYRANRRQRYVAHREAMSKETQHILKQTFLKEC